MNKQNKEYLKRSCEMIETMLPLKADEMVQWYAHHENMCRLEMNDDLIFCLFSLPALTSDGRRVSEASDLKSSPIEQIFLFVYDQDILVADCSAFHCSLKDLLFWQPIAKYFSANNDWLYLACYALNKCLPDELGPQNTQGEALIYNNAYVTLAYRRRGIFANMVQIMRDFALRKILMQAELYSAIALDPDIACYGPDASDKPYYYSYEKDEPLRARNRTVIEHLGFTPMKLDEFDTAENRDGTKIWFAVCHECDLSEEEIEKMS
jgi:hypothetical protein